MTSRSTAWRTVAVVLALATLVLAVRAWSWTLRLDATEARAAVLARALVAMQGADGAFDPYPEDPDIPQVRRTGPHALATYALLRLANTRAGGVVEGLSEATDRAIDVLLARQQAGGMFGGLPPGVGNPWPAVETTAEALLALSESGRAEDRGALVSATSALVRAAEYGFRDGWTRAIGALGLAAAARTGALGEAGGSLSRLLPLSESVDRIDCGDYALAEAIAAGVQGRGDALAERVVAACLERPPVWEGQTSDPQGWWMAAWVAARTPGGRAWLEAVEAAVAQAVEAPPEGSIPGGWFADPVTQSAAGLLVLVEILDARDGAEDGA